MDLRLRKQDWLPTGQVVGMVVEGRIVTLWLYGSLKIATLLPFLCVNASFIAKGVVQNQLITVPRAVLDNYGLLVRLRESMLCRVT
jgi:hypothetical protein